VNQSAGVEQPLRFLVKAALVGARSAVVGSVEEVLVPGQQRLPVPPADPIGRRSAKPAGTWSMA